MALRHERLNQFLNIVARANKPRASFRLSNSHYSTSHRFILTSNLRILLRYGRLQLTSADSRYIFHVLYSKQRSTPRFRYGAQVSIYMRQSEDSLIFAVGDRLVLRGCIYRTIIGPLPRVGGSGGILFATDLSQ